MNQNLTGVPMMGVINNGTKRVVEIPKELEDILIEFDGKGLEEALKVPDNKYFKLIESVNESFLKAGRIRKHNLHKNFAGNKTIIKSMLYNRKNMEELFSTKDMIGNTYMIPIHGENYNEFFISLRKDEKKIFGEVYTIKMYDNFRTREMGHFISYYGKDGQFRFIEISEDNVKFLCESLLSFYHRGLNYSSIVETLTAIHESTGYIMFDTLRPVIVLKDLTYNSAKGVYNITLKYGEVSIVISYNEEVFYVSKISGNVLKAKDDENSYSVVASTWNKEENEGGMYANYSGLTYESALRRIDSLVEEIIEEIKCLRDTPTIKVTDSGKGVLIEDVENKVSYIVSIDR